MTQRASVLFKIAWISLAIIGVAILVFGLIATVVPTTSNGPPYLRAIGVASIGMGMFGLLITTIVYRRRNGGHGLPYGITQCSGQRTS